MSAFTSGCELAMTLDRSRRLITAEAIVTRELAALPAGWLVEPYVLVDGRRIPFVVIGPSGFFVIGATDGRWTLDDLQLLAELGEQLAEGWPAFSGRVTAVLCLALESASPRAWFGGATHGGRGGWVLGIDWLARWLASDDGDRSISDDDLARLTRAAGPRWTRAGTRRLPAKHAQG